jgi:hypothetical protein
LKETGPSHPHKNAGVLARQIPENGFEIGETPDEIFG